MRKLTSILMTIGLIFLLSNCEKQQIGSELEMRTAENFEVKNFEVKAEPTFSKENLQFTEEIVFKEPVANSRSSAYGYNYQEVFSNSYSLGTNKWINLKVDKRELSRTHQYVAVLTPEYGDPDVYVRSSYADRYGRVYNRNRRSSIRRGQHLDESWLNYRDMDAHETHGAFSFYGNGNNRCGFKLTIYQVPSNTIWIRHASSHYGRKNIQVRYNNVQYNVQPNTAVAMEYNNNNKNLSIWQCTSSNNNQYCGWKSNTTSSSTSSQENYMYSLADDNTGNSTGGIGFGVTSSSDE